MRYAAKTGILWAAGGALYCLIELLWRQRTHWSMMIVGGACFVLIGGLNEIYRWETALLSQMVLSGLIVTGVELAAGLVLNVWLGLGVWDYSGMPYAFMGQICLLYSVLWVVLSVPAILLDDWIRWKWFHEDKPHYKLI